MGLWDGSESQERAGRTRSREKGVVANLMSGIVVTAQLRNRPNTTPVALGGHLVRCLRWGAEPCEGGGDALLTKLSATDWLHGRRF